MRLEKQIKHVSTYNLPLLNYYSTIKKAETTNINRILSIKFSAMTLYVLAEGSKL